MIITVLPTNLLSWNSNNVRCELGRNGINLNKKEGDGITPAGTFPLRKVFFRADRLPAPETSLPTVALKPEDGWSDDPKDPAYNKQIKLPHSYRHEKLWRNDHIYDVIIELGQNDNPPKPGYGSAIFIHVAKLDQSPTEGCIALKLEDLLLLLRNCDQCTTINILS